MKYLIPVYIAVLVYFGYLVVELFSPAFQTLFNALEVVK